MYDPEKQEWILVLSKYQRDNLLWLLNACGYPAVSNPGDGKIAESVPPFTNANTGDWLGEMCIMLMGPSQWPGIVKGDRPNKSFEDLRKDVQTWARDWVKAHPLPIPPGVPAEKKDDRW